jgi:hypothetical protein
VQAAKPAALRETVSVQSRSRGVGDGFWRGRAPSPPRSSLAFPIQFDYFVIPTMCAKFAMEPCACLSGSGGTFRSRHMNVIRKKTSTPRLSKLKCPNCGRPRARYGWRCSCCHWRIKATPIVDMILAVLVVFSLTLLAWKYR